MTARHPGYGHVVMLSVQASSDASPAAVWALLAEPKRWSSWAPHIRGAVGLGTPEVQLGRRGVVFVLPGVVVPVRVSAKSEGRSWEWTTGPMRFLHRVEPHGDGSLITLELSGPPRLERVVAFGYGPIIRRVIRRLATVASPAH
jgi:hypothetical protein